METFYVSLHTTTSRQFAVIYLASATTSEVRLLNTEMPDAEPVCFLPRRKDHGNAVSIVLPACFLSSAQPRGEKLWSPRTHERDEQQWETLIAPREDVMLEGFTLFT